MKERESVGFLLFVLVEGFYSVEENVIVVLTKHFYLLCNDDCLVNGRAIITILDDWQVLSADMPRCLTAQLPVPSTC